MNSLAINTTILVSRAVILEIMMPAPALIKPVVALLIFEADLVNISVISYNTFFLFKLFDFFLNYSLSILSDSNIFS